MIAVIDCPTLQLSSASSSTAVNCTSSANRSACSWFPPCFSVYDAVPEDCLICSVTSVMNFSTNRPATVNYAAGVSRHLWGSLLSVRTHSCCHPVSPGSLLLSHDNDFCLYPVSQLCHRENSSTRPFCFWGQFCEAKALCYPARTDLQACWVVQQLYETRSLD